MQLRDLRNQIVSPRHLPPLGLGSMLPPKRCLAASRPTLAGNAVPRDPPDLQGDSTNVARERRFFPRRAVMYVPASDERKTAKAASLKVDSIVYDIEDGVAANQKVTLVTSQAIAYLTGYIMST